MRANLWPQTLRDWRSGLMVSVPFAFVLLSTRGGDTQTAVSVASVAIVLGVPWVVPGTMLLAVLSAPVYMWLHTLGPVPPVLEWLGGVVLVAAVAGCHLNAVLLFAWRRTRRSSAKEVGLRDFLFRHGQHR